MSPRWSLTADALERLLAYLDPERSAAAQRFELLRRQLIAYLTYEGSPDPERWADTVLDRLAKRISEGHPIDNPSAWARGAAKLVLRESQLEVKRETAAMREATPLLATNGPAGREHTCLDECLGGLAPESRHLIVRYYQSDHRTLIPARKRLAAEIGISVEALRNRALRIRKSVEGCMSDCLKRAT